MNIYPKGSEVVRRAVGITLKTQMATVLPQVWAAWASYDTADGITVPQPGVKGVYWRNKGRIADFPAIVVTGPRGKAEQEGYNDWEGMAHTIHVVTDVLSDNEEILDAIVNRYLIAEWEILGTNHALDGSLSGEVGLSLLGYEAVQYKEQMVGGGQRLHGVGILDIVVRVEDAF